MELDEAKALIAVDFCLISPQRQQCGKTAPEGLQTATGTLVAAKEKPLGEGDTSG